MISNFYQAVPALADHCHGGEGTIKIVEIFNRFSTAMQHFHYTVLPPGTSIGVHTHGDDEEFYAVLAGTGLMKDGDEEHTVGPGDVILNKPFGTHSLKNTSETEDLQLLVFEVKGAGTP